MMPSRLLPAVLAASFALLTACADPSAEQAAGDGPEPLPDATYARVIDQGVDPAHVFTIDLAGFHLAEQSAGVMGDADYGAHYYDAEAPDRLAVLRVAAGSYDHERCATTPLLTPAGGRPDDVRSCVPDDQGWYRRGDGRHEYVVAAGDSHLVLNAPTRGVDRETLVAAVLAARRQEGGVVRPDPPAPVERGDLPTTGDGAPVDQCDTDCPGG